MYPELETLDVADVVDPEWKWWANQIGNFASGRLLDVINANDVITMHYKV